MNVPFDLDRCKKMGRVPQVLKIDFTNEYLIFQKIFCVVTPANEDRYKLMFFQKLGITSFEPLNPPSNCELTAEGTLLPRDFFCCTVILLGQFGSYDYPKFYL